MIRVAVLGDAHIHSSDYLTEIANNPALELVTGLGDDAGSASFSDTDLAVITTETGEHRRALAAVLQARVPVLLEKPVADDALDFEAIIALSEAANTPVAVAMFLRCAEALAHLRGLIASSGCGQPSRIELSFTHSGFVDGWFQNERAWMATGRSAFADLAIHLLDVLVWMAPQGTLEICGATLVSGSGQGPVDTGGTAKLLWNGVPTAIHTSWTSRPGGLRIAIRGSEGDVHLSDGMIRTTFPETTRQYAKPTPVDALRACCDPRWLSGDQSLCELPGPSETRRVAELLAEIRRVARSAP